MQYAPPQVRLGHSEVDGKHCELGESEDRLFAMAWDILFRNSNVKDQASEKHTPDSNISQQSQCIEMTQHALFARIAQRTKKDV